MDRYRLPKAVLFFETEWAKKKRTTKMTTKRTLQSEGRAVNINDLKAAEQTAANRDRWKILVSCPVCNV